jgi:hypothetical protein
MFGASNGGQSFLGPERKPPLKGMYGDDNIKQGPTGAASFMNAPADEFANDFADDSLPAGINVTPVGAATNLPALSGPTFNKGNQQSLDPLIAPLRSYPTIKQQPIPVTGAAGSLASDIRKRGNARSAAQSLAQAYSSGQVDAAAQAIANSALGTEADSAAWADAMTEAAALHPTVAPPLLAKSANLAMTTGHADEFAATMADAFATARQKKVVPQFTATVADAIAAGGPSCRYVFGQVGRALCIKYALHLIHVGPLMVYPRLCDLTMLFTCVHITIHALASMPSWW